MYIQVHVRGGVVYYENTQGSAHAVHAVYVYVHVQVHHKLTRVVLSEGKSVFSSANKCMCKKCAIHLHFT